MDIKFFKNNVWNHYLLIENEFIKTFNYVSLDIDNFNTFSEKYFTLIQLIGSEIDTILKDLCDLSDKPFPEGNKLKNIHHYCEIINNNYPNFSNEEIYVNRIRTTIIPWEKWSYSKNYVKTSNNKEYYKYSGNNPKWWSAYNKVKHTRTSTYKYANLKNTLYSLSALYILNIYLYSELINNHQKEDSSSWKNNSIRFSKLFVLKSLNNSIENKFVIECNFYNNKIYFNNL